MLAETAFRATEAALILTAHSHLPRLVALAGGRTALNPGSVGQPRDGDARAAYAVIEDNRIELKRVIYPIEETVARVEALPLPERAKQLLAHSFRHGRLPESTLEDGVSA